MQKTFKCWHCNTQLKDTEIFCASCTKIQPPTQIDHFTRMQMPHDFDLGIKKLEVAYFSLQTKLHPDRFTQKTDREKMFSMQQSMEINAAYETLKNPLTRAEYMLKLEGIIVNTDNATIKPSQEILLESLETRERLSQITKEDELRKLLFETIEAKLTATDKIKQNFTENKLPQAAQETIKLRYLEKLHEEIKGESRKLEVRS